MWYDPLSNFKDKEIEAQSQQFNNLDYTTSKCQNNVVVRWDVTGLGSIMACCSCCVTLDKLLILSEVWRGYFLPQRPEKTELVSQVRSRGGD